MSAAPPPKAGPKPPPRPASPPPATAKTDAPQKSFAVSKGAMVGAQTIVIYGAGAIGKTELAANMEQVGVKPLFIDLEDGTRFLNVDRVRIETWDDLLSVVRSDACDDYGAIVVDSFTRGEEMAVAWTLDNVRAEKSGERVKSIESYGWGKGYTHVYETFLHLLSALDRHSRNGRHVVAIAHDCTNSVPNPMGEDFLRYEPRLQNKNNGNIRARVREWCDHMLYVGHDVSVKNGKSGDNVRTIHPVESPAAWAKSRSLDRPITYHRHSAEIWQQLFNIQEGN